MALHINIKNIISIHEINESDSMTAYEHLELFY